MGLDLLPYVLRAVARVPTELKKHILQARLAKKMTQAQLAQVCFLPTSSTCFTPCPHPLHTGAAHLPELSVS